MQDDKWYERIDADNDITFKVREWSVTPGMSREQLSRRSAGLVRIGATFWRCMAPAGNAGIRLGSMFRHTTHDVKLPCH